MLAKNTQIFENRTMPTLYHYVHCPFCLRVRMVAGYLDIAYTSKVLPYDDEKTPQDLGLPKMLPIWQSPGFTSNESLEIIRFLDQEGTFSSPLNPEFEDYLNRLGKPLHSLAMPYWIYTPEFTSSSRHYFQAKKEVKRGPFAELYKNRDVYHKELEPLIREGLDFIDENNFGIHDICLSAHLWGLYIVPEFQFDKDVHLYLQSIKKKTKFDYHQDFGKTAWQLS